MDKQTEWAAHVAAWRASGKTASVYCAEHGLKLGALRYWSVRIDRQQGVDGVQKQVPARIRLAQVRTGSVARPGAVGALSLSIGEVTVQVPAGMDVAVLRQTVAMLLDVVGGRR